MHRFALAAVVAILSAAGFALLACQPSSRPPVVSVPVAKPDAQPLPHAAVVARLVGVWVGMAEGTPLGDIRFPLAFDREPDGSVHARTDDGKGMYLDFRFVERGGAWLLVEEGEIPSVGKQTHTLSPVPNATRWSDKDVDVLVAIDGDTLVMTTAVHGKPHATFRLQRKSGPEGEQIRAQLEKQASHPPVAE
jgi:hypothetical protein